VSQSQEEHLRFLIGGCVEKNLSCQRKLYELFADTLFLICLRYVKSKEDAEDILQESFLKIFDKVHTYQGSGSFEGWLKRITINNCLRYLERKKNLQFTAEETEIELKVPPSYGEHDYKFLLNLIQQLPAGYQTIFNLFVLDGLSHQEIAQELNISEGTSKSQLSRARKLLQAALQKHNIKVAV